MAIFKSLGPISLSFVLGLSEWGQSRAARVDPSGEPRDQSSTLEPKQGQKHEPGAAREIGAGAGTVGVSAAKGVGDIAKGTGKGALDLVTLHPIDAGASIGKGAVSASKDVTVGTVKGTGKVGKGVGRAFKHAGSKTFSLGKYRGSPRSRCAERDES